MQRQSRAATERVRADIGARPLDVEKLRADLDASRAARDKLRPAIQQILLDVLPQLSDDGRTILSTYRVAQRRRAEP